MTTSSNSLFRGVQALRFIAAFMVVLTHSTFYAHERLTPDLSVWQNGTAGVDIFFVISGFVMYLSSRHLEFLKDGWVEFGARRLIRIVPLYWAITTFKLILLISGSSAILHSEINWIYILKSYFFIPAYNVDGIVEPLLGVGWTLIFEMFFYALFAITLTFRMRIIPTLTIFLFACAAASLFRTPEWPAWTVYANIRVLEFLAGIYIAAWGQALASPTIAITSIVAGFAVVIFPPHLSGPLAIFALRVMPATAIVFGTVNLEGNLRKLLPEWLVFLGTASYSLYLIHPVTAPASPTILNKLGFHNSILSIIGSISIATVFAIAAYKLLEKPTAKWLTKKTSKFWKASEDNSRLLRRRVDLKFDA